VGSRRRRAGTTAELQSKAQREAALLQAHDSERLIFDWAGFGPARFRASRPVAVNDETLRDGPQSPSVIDPPIAAKIEIVHKMARLDIECASMGIPAAGPRHREDALRLCREIADAGSPCALRGWGVA
jgi:hypothetical protein